MTAIMPTVKRQSLWFGVTVISVMLAGYAQGQTGQPLDFVKDVIPHLRPTLCPEGHPAVSVVTKSTWQDPGDVPPFRFERINRFSRRGVVLTTIRADKAFIDGYNSQYAFRLERANGQNDWKLTSLVMAGDPGYDVLAARAKLDADHGVLAAPVNVSGLDLKEVAAFKSFKVIDCRMVHVRGRDLVKVEFSVQPTREELTRYGTVVSMSMGRSRTDTVWIDPDRWVMVEYKSIGPNPQGNVVGTTHIDYHFDERGRPTGYTVTGESFQEQPDGKPPLPGTKVSSEATILLPDDIPDREFMLTAFGLPEPKGVEPPGPRVPLYVWLIAGGVAVAVLAYLVRRRLIRRRPEAVSA